MDPNAKPNPNDQGDPPKTPGTTPDNSGKGQGDPPPAPPADDQNPPWLPERLERAQRIAVEDLLKTLGFENTETLTTALGEFKTLRETQMTEQERQEKAVTDAQAEIAQTKQEAEDLKGQLAAEKQQRLDDQRDAAVKDAARDAGAEHPEDIVLYAKSDAETLAGLMGEEGAVNTEAITALIKKAQEERPIWFGRRGPGSPSNADGKLPSTDKKRVEEFKKQRRRSVL